MTTEPKTPAPDPKEIFLASLDKRDPAERAAYLEAACVNAPGVRQAVDELLREAKEVGDFLETPAVSAYPAHRIDPAPRGPGGELLAAVLLEKAGDRIGNYRLLQKIGEGGCGAVYMADQEQPVRRRVALKIIKLGMDTKQVVARFDAERQALALMDHPSIARVLEAGATETGRPYFVMELVRGIKITDYCNQNKLTTDDRLKLFIQVCQAIQHAHQKGIIHRDIKPSNILVTSHDGKPVPKVIDFGVAKATHHQKLTDLTIFTAYEQFIGTPAYMSPEQAEMSGLDVDTRSDIYSLGVLLYELLTGKTPFDAEALLRGSLDECRRTIREVEPVWPSTRVSTLLQAERSATAIQRGAEPPRLISLLRGDLDWIVMKALEKDRTRRYATANDLALDVERYLGSEAVLARPPGNWYRLGKVLRRHQKVVAAAAAVALTLVAGAAISTWQAIRATKAEQQAHTAQQIEAKLRRQAELEGLRAKDQAELARLNEYVADISLAQQSLSAGNFGRAVQLLEKHRPQPGAAGLAGFEWRYLWQLARGDENLPLPTQDGAVQSLAFSPSGDLIAIGLPDKLVIMDARSRATVASLPRRVFAMAFLPDGKSLIVASPTSVRIYSTTDWSEQKSLEHVSGPIALSRDGSRLAASSREGIRLLDTTTWGEVSLLPETRGQMQFSPDGQRLAAESRLGIEVRELADSTATLILENSTNLFFGGGPWFRPGRLLTFSPDGQSILAARNIRSDRGFFVVSVWDARSGKEIATLPPDRNRPEHTGMIASLDFSPDGQVLATASMDHSVRLWNFAERQPLVALHGHLNEVWAVAFAPDGKSLVSGAKDGGLKLWPLRRQKKEDVLAAASLPLAFSKDGRTLAAVDARKDAAVFINIATGEPERQFQLEPKRFRFPGSVAVSADLATLAEAGENGSVKLWNTKDGDPVIFKAGDAPVGMVSLSPDGRQLITGARQQPLRWWDLPSGTSTTLDARARRATFSPDGRTLAVSGMDAGIQLWDVATRTLTTNLVLHSSSAGNVVFSPDGKLLATTAGPDNYENSIHLWDIPKGKLAGTFTGHKQSVFSVAFSPDGRTLASGSDDGTLKLWNIATQQELLTTPIPNAVVSDLRFSPDGTLLVGANGNFMDANGIRLFRAPAPEPAAGK